MRVGPPSDVLAQAVSMWPVVDIVRGGRVLAVDLPVEGVKLEATATRVVQSKLSFEAPLSMTPRGPLDPLNWFGQRAVVRVVTETVDGRRFETPLGQYMIGNWSTGKDSVSVDAFDLTQMLEDDPMPWASSPAPWATFRSELQRLAGNLPVVVEGVGPNVPVASSYQWGNSRTDAVRSLATAFGCDTRMGADGCLHVVKRRDASMYDAVYEAATLGDGLPGNGLLVEADPAPPWKERQPNRWVVTGTVGGDTDGQKFSATRERTGEPFDPDAYGWVTSLHNLSGASSQQAVEEAVDARMRGDVDALESRSIGIVPDPRIEIGDVVYVATEWGESFAGRVTAYSMSLSDVKSTMRVDLGILMW